VAQVLADTLRYGEQQLGLDGQSRSHLGLSGCPFVEDHEGRQEPFGARR
jgi:hypothetical protein